MTVCVAAIFEGGGIVVVTDRQYTDTGTDFGYESGQPKIYGLSDQILGLVADDMSFQSELMYATKKQIKAMPKDNPLPLKDVVDIYLAFYHKRFLECQERAILFPQKLTWETWKEVRSKGKSEDTFIQIITEQLKDYKMSFGVETIFAGIDSDQTPNIYVFNDHEKDNREKDPRFESAKGFAAIGSGAFDAEAYIGLTGYHRFWFRVDTCFVAYVAKKRSQTIRTVGDDTTIVVMKHGKKFQQLSPEEYKIFEREYQRLEKDIERNEQKTRARVQARINECTDTKGVLGPDIW